MCLAPRSRRVGGSYVVLTSHSILKYLNPVPLLHRDSSFQDSLRASNTGSRGE